MKKTHSNKLPQIDRKSDLNPDGRSVGGTKFYKGLQSQLSEQKPASWSLREQKTASWIFSEQKPASRTLNPNFEKLYRSNKQLPHEIQPLTDDGQGSETCNQHQGLYPEGMIRNVNVRLPIDERTCDIRAMCFLSDGRILMSDFNNNKLKLLDSNLSMIHHCDFQYCPNGVCMLNDTEAAVVDGYSYIQFVSVVDKIEIGGKIQLDHYCVGLVFCGGELYVSDGFTNIHVYTFKGQKLRTIRSGLNDGPEWYSEWLTVSNDGTMIYMTNYKYGIVCLGRLSGTGIWKVKDTDGHIYSGLCVDRYNNVFVCRYKKHDVVQFSPDGQLTRVVLNASGGIRYPQSMCMDEVRGRIFVGLWKMDMAKVFNEKRHIHHYIKHF